MRQDEHAAWRGVGMGKDGRKMRDCLEQRHGRAPLSRLRNTAGNDSLPDREPRARGDFHRQRTSGGVSGLAVSLPFFTRDVRRCSAADLP